MYGYKSKDIARGCRTASIAFLFIGGSKIKRLLVPWDSFWPVADAGTYLTPLATHSTVTTFIMIRFFIAYADRLRLLVIALLYFPYFVPTWVMWFLRCSMWAFGLFPIGGFWFTLLVTFSVFWASITPVNDQLLTLMQWCSEAMFIYGFRFITNSLFWVYCALLWSW